MMRDAFELAQRRKSHMVQEQGEHELQEWADQFHVSLLPDHVVKANLRKTRGEFWERFHYRRGKVTAIARACS